MAFRQHNREGKGGRERGRGTWICTAGDFPGCEGREERRGDRMLINERLSSSQFQQEYICKYASKQSEKKVRGWMRVEVE